MTTLSALPMSGIEHPAVNDVNSSVPACYRPRPAAPGLLTTTAES
jgi:hypothetical protein